MPLEADDQQRVDDAIRDAEGSTKLLVRDPAESQKLGPFDVMCTIWNRTIGSGIYVTPAIILKSTNSVGVSLLLWAFGVIIGMSALLVWLELGLSVPKYDLSGRDSMEPHEGEKTLECVPRNGGEKNYLEYIYKAPKLRVICMYGVVYVILGNLSGNAIAFGYYVLNAAGIEGHAAAARGLAIGCLTVACLLHASWRNGGIMVNNALACLKMLILLAVIGIGFAASAGAKFGHGPVHGDTIDPITGKVTSNFDTSSSFAHPRHDAASYADSILFIVYTFSGYEQPFYVLSEVSRPKKIFAKSTLFAMGLVSLLFMLVNVAFLCAVDFDQRLDNNLDMATLFFSEVFGNNAAPRVMSGIIALSILGNIVVMTFTASRVKQEIAKEGVLISRRISLFFASSTTTPYAYLKECFFPSRLPPTQRPPTEQSPAAALLLHWIFSIIMIGATSSTIPAVAYTVLVALYSYTVVVLVGFFVASGLLYLRFVSIEKKDWIANAGFKPWGGPTAAIIYATVCAFLLVASFLPPSAGSPFHKSSTEVEWWIVPTVGLGTMALGYIYYLMLAYVIPKVRKQVLVVDREAIIVKEGEEWIQAVELVEADWVARQGPGPHAGEDGNGQYYESVNVQIAK